MMRLVDKHIIIIHFQLSFDKFVGSDTDDDDDDEDDDDGYASDEMTEEQADNMMFLYMRE